MTKQLLLIRHAQAMESHSGERDFDRALTSNGFINAAELGMYMFKQSLHPDAIFVSAALRAHTTAITIAEKINFEVDKLKVDPNIYETSPRAMMESVNEFDNLWEIVAIIGHNPVLTYFAEYLSSAMIGNMSTASMAAITFDVDKWEEVSGGNGQLDFYYNPSDKPAT